jgi:hypothetical protein
MGNTIVVIIVNLALKLKRIRKEGHVINEKYVYISNFGWKSNFS